MVYVRGGKNACFYHKPIHDRTPLQRTCPEYHENGSYKKIDNPLDIIYINNGGVPLYLCNMGERFELRAYFPMISDASMLKLKKLGAKIKVNSSAFSEIDKKIYNVDNLNFYPVNTSDKWIDIECIPNVYIRDVQLKWLWGIRGVDIERDIYHSNKDGGYRIAVKANINIRKTYRIMFYKNPCKIAGIDFKKIGEMVLKEKDISKTISIYDMTIEEFTEEARKFIEVKGYKLVEASDELLPLWPPAIFKGNEITFNEDKAFFLHINNSKKGVVYYAGDDELIKMSNARDSNNSVISVTTYKGRSFVVSQEYNEKVKYQNEIKYNVLYSKLLVKKQPLNQKIIIKDSNDIEINFNEQGLKPPKDKKLYIKSNIPFCATVNNKNYVISSSSKCFEDVDYNWNMVIDSRAFGIRSYVYKRDMMELSLGGGIDWRVQYERLYRCTTPTIKSNNKYIRVLYLLSKNIDRNNIQLYRLLETWIKTNAIPMSAIKYLDGMEKSLGGTVNE
ncbi:hypothetical protein [Clostridium algidicarnis]|uniref:hypothetical protein n=1 Tax=Clostridium algidicarnis TaxID=37659 RepID=UPI001C0B6494|nr:hypothetical protein [Clostridium algidicarnis]MBU3203605.1 hypothetical protein [Clostridium algidicarnis]MBU3211759.1 hypothetical protein [Clostridium algidicarnis]